MSPLWKKHISCGSIGESFADAVFTTHTELQPNLPQVGIAPKKIFEELIYLDTFIFEQAVNRVFAEEAFGQAILNAFAARLVFNHLQRSAETFQGEYDERRSSFLLGWCAPPNQQAGMYVAGEICQRCGNFDYRLLTFFTTRVAHSYLTAMELLTEVKCYSEVTLSHEPTL